MFFEPRVNVIESDSGFSVEVLGQTGIRYSEGDKSMVVDSEVLAYRGMQIFSKSIRMWDPPYCKEPITPEKKAAIIGNIRAALEFKSEPLFVD